MLSEFRYSVTVACPNLERDLIVKGKAECHMVITNSNNYMRRRL